MKKHSVFLTNLLYIVTLPILIAIVLYLGFSLLRSNVDSKTPEVQTKIEGVNSIAKPNSSTLEDIVGNEIDSFMGTSQNDKNLNTDSDFSVNPEVYNDNGNKIDYENMTVSEILGKAEENSSKQTHLEKDLAVPSNEGTYKGITKDGAIVVNIDKKEKYIYMIGVNKLDVESISYFLSDCEKLYIEYDVQKKLNGAEQAYVWIDVPDNNNKDSMLNVIALENGWGTYADSMPNIKYSYYFLKITD